jgi:hypothetical protein
VKNTNKVFIIVPKQLQNTNQQELRGKKTWKVKKKNMMKMSNVRKDKEQILLRVRRKQFKQGDSGPKVYTGGLGWVRDSAREQ